MQSYLNKICASKEFANHDHYEELLRYLVASALKNESPKEISVAVEIFKKNRDYDPSLDSTVRVYVHNLRKKLLSYYQKEGKNDSIKITIPKGHYKVEFQEDYSPAPQRNNKLFMMLGAGLVLICAFIIGWQAVHQQKEIISKGDPIWGDALDRDQKATIVLGDHYFFKGRLFGKSWNIRDVHINSEEEFEDYRDSLSLAISPDIGRLDQYNKSYFPTRIPWCLANIATIFNHNHLPFDMRLGSNFQWNEINENNIVYVGSFRGIGFLKNVLREHFHYDNKNQELTIMSDSSKATPVFTATLHSDYPMVDYAIVIKRPGPRDNTLYFFLSTHDIGSIETTRLFSNPNNIRTFEKTHFKGKKNVYFEAVFEVKGFSHSSMEHQLVYFNEIDE